MKNWQLFEIKKNWNALKVLSGGKGYYLPLVKNIKKIDIELEAFELLKSRPEGFEQFVKEKDELLKKYAKVNENNEPIKNIEMVDGLQYYKYEVDDCNKEALEIEGKVLVEKHQELLHKMALKEQQYESMLNEDCTIDFVKIDEKDLPDEMTPELFTLIEEFING